MAYIDPKTDWNEAYEPSPEDMNRIEGNIKQERADRKADVDAEESARIAAVNAEESARIAAVNAEESARIAAVNAEESARIAAIINEAGERMAGDNAEEGERIMADNNLQDNINAEESARIAADNALNSVKAGLTDDNTFTGDNTFSSITLDDYFNAIGSIVIAYNATNLTMVRGSVYGGSGLRLYNVDEPFNSPMVNSTSSPLGDALSGTYLCVASVIGRRYYPGIEEYHWRASLFVKLS